MERKERINEVFAYLLDQGLIHTQKDLAKAINSTTPNISKMLKGDPKVLTDSMCRRIHKKYKIISADWIISGEGNMLTMDSNNAAAEQQPLPDYSSLINATIAAMDSTIASLKRELVERDAVNKAALEAKDETIASLKRELDTKDVLVGTLRQQVTDLSLALSVLREKDASGYPFTLGVADDGGIPTTSKTTKTPAKFPSNHK